MGPIAPEPSSVEQMNSFQKTYTLNLPVEQIPSYVKHILEELGPLDLDGDTLFAIRLSVEEALTNAIKHGNKMDVTKKVFLHIDATFEKVEIEVVDEGEGFDYQRISPPTKKENLQKTSGRGIFLIKNYMDKVEFFDGGRRMKMIKYVK
ncbi:MAG: ATP-binding protein [Candidatus Omnitrophota bacterium]|nr:MAG: ATP-binding protein [Candidatus Omnitrophota bacterium]